MEKEDGRTSCRSARMLRMQCGICAHVITGAGIRVACLFFVCVFVFVSAWPDLPASPHDKKSACVCDSGLCFGSHIVIVIIGCHCSLPSHTRPDSNKHADKGKGKYCVCVYVSSVRKCASLVLFMFWQHCALLFYNFFSLPSRSVRPNLKCVCVCVCVCVFPLSIQSLFLFGFLLLVLSGRESLEKQKKIMSVCVFDYVL